MLNQEQGYIPLGNTLLSFSSLHTLGFATVHCQPPTLSDLRLPDAIRTAKSDTLEQPWCGPWVALEHMAMSIWLLPTIPGFLPVTHVV